MCTEARRATVCVNTVRKNPIHRRRNEEREEEIETVKRGEGMEEEEKEKKELKRRKRVRGMGKVARSYLD